MRRAPPLSKIADFPLTGGVCLLAVVATILSWSQGPSALDPVTMHPAAFHGEPWRLLASALPHGDVLHLVFNLYWVWLFGTVIEERLGTALTAGLVVFMAAGSAAAEYAVFWGGIGLSGVVYGLFGMLQVLRTRDPRFLGTLDQRTNQLLIAWFFIAIGLDFAGFMSIAHMAHASGWAIGAALGLAVSAKHTKDRVNAIALNVLWVIGIALAATVGLPVVNMDGGGGRDLGYRAVMALEDGRSAEGLELLERAAELGTFDRDIWLSIAEEWDRLGEPVRAAEARARGGVSTLPPKAPAPPESE